ncbi:hypothetical protein ACTXT7_008802 [Hymenolepis weldensis]
MTNQGGGSQLSLRTLLPSRQSPVVDANKYIVVCIRASDKGEGLEFLVAKSQQEELTTVGSRGDLLQNLLSYRDSSSRFHFRKVDLTRVSGQNVVGKIEYLLTCLNFA